MPLSHIWLYNTASVGHHSLFFRERERENDIFNLGEAKSAPNLAFIHVTVFILP